MTADNSIGGVPRSKLIENYRIDDERLFSRVPPGRAQNPEFTEIPSCGKTDSGEKLFISNGRVFVMSNGTLLEITANGKRREVPKFTKITSEGGKLKLPQKEVFNPASNLSRLTNFSDSNINEQVDEVFRLNMHEKGLWLGLGQIGTYYTRGFLGGGALNYIAQKLPNDVLLSLGIEKTPNNKYSIGETRVVGSIEIRSDITAKNSSSEQLFMPVFAFENNEKKLIISNVYGNNLLIHLSLMLRYLGFQRDQVDISRYNPEGKVEEIIDNLKMGDSRLEGKFLDRINIKQSLEKEFSEYKREKRYEVLVRQKVIFEERMHKHIDSLMSNVEFKRRFETILSNETGIPVSEITDEVRRQFLETGKISLNGSENPIVTGILGKSLNSNEFGEYKMLKLISNRIEEIKRLELAPSKEAQAINKAISNIQKNINDIESFNAEIAKIEGDREENYELRYKGNVYGYKFGSCVVLKIDLWYGELAAKAVESLIRKHGNPNVSIEVEFKGTAGGKGYKAQSQEEEFRGTAGDKNDKQLHIKVTRFQTDGAVYTTSGTRVNNEEVIGGEIADLSASIKERFFEFVEERSGDRIYRFKKDVNEEALKLEGNMETSKQLLALYRQSKGVPFLVSSPLVENLQWWVTSLLSIEERQYVSVECECGHLIAMAETLKKQGINLELKPPILRISDGPFIKWSTIGGEPKAKPAISSPPQNASKAKTMAAVEIKPADGKVIQLPNGRNYQADGNTVRESVPKQNPGHSNVQMPVARLGIGRSQVAVRHPTSPTAAQTPTVAPPANPPQPAVPRPRQRSVVRRGLTAAVAEVQKKKKFTYFRTPKGLIARASKEGSNTRYEIIPGNQLTAEIRAEIKGGLASGGMFVLAGTVVDQLFKVMEGKGHEINFASIVTDSKGNLISISAFTGKTWAMQAAGVAKGAAGKLVFYFDAAKNFKDPVSTTAGVINVAAFEVAMKLRVGHKIIPVGPEWLKTATDITVALIAAKGGEKAILALAQNGGVKRFLDNPVIKTIQGAANRITSPATLAGEAAASLIPGNHPVAKPLTQSAVEAAVFIAVVALIKKGVIKLPIAAATLGIFGDAIRLVQKIEKDEGTNPAARIRAGANAGMIVFRGGLNLIVSRVPFIGAGLALGTDMIGKSAQDNIDAFFEVYENNERIKIDKKEFQRRMKILMRQSVSVAERLEKLIKEINPLADRAIRTIGSTTIQSGTRSNPTIKILQEILKKIGAYRGQINGNLDTATLSALEKYLGGKIKITKIDRTILEEVKMALPEMVKELRGTAELISKEHHLELPRPNPKHKKK